MSVKQKIYVMKLVETGFVTKNNYNYCIIVLWQRTVYNENY